MKRTRQQWKVGGPFQHHFRVSRQRESWSHRVAHPTYRAWCEACVREPGRDADHNRLAVEQDQVIDDVSVDYAFFGEHDQTAKLVLILREHQRRQTEALPVQNRRRPNTSGFFSPLQTWSDERDYRDSSSSQIKTHRCWS